MQVTDQLLGQLGVSPATPERKAESNGFWYSYILGFTVGSRKVLSRSCETERRSCDPAKCAAAAWTGEQGRGCTGRSLMFCTYASFTSPRSYYSEGPDESTYTSSSFGGEVTRTTPTSRNTD